MAAPSDAAEPQSALLAALHRLVADRPAGEGTGLPRQARSGNVLDQLDLELQVGGDHARVLLTGQIGVGKSTELHEFVRRTAASGKVLAIRCDLEKQISPERCGAVGVLLAVFRDAWSFWRSYFRMNEPPRALAESILNDLAEWLHAEKTGGGYVFDFGGMPFPINRAEPVERAVAIVLGKAAQHQALAGHEAVPDKLVVRCNEYLDRVAQESGKAVVLLVDHVDKIRDERAAQQTLIEAVTHWERLRAGLVMTAPYEFTIGERRFPVERYWGRPIMLYPEPIPESASQGAIPEFYGAVRSACRLERVVADEHLRRLAYLSGGVPRMFVLLLSAAVRAAVFGRQSRVDTLDVDLASSAAESDYQDYADDDLAQIEEIVASQQGLARAREILRSPIALLVREQAGGSRSFHAHPLAERSLERYRLRQRLSSAGGR